MTELSMTDRPTKFRRLGRPVAIAAAILLALGVMSMPASASQASWLSGQHLNSGAQSGNDCAIFYVRAGYLNYIKGQSAAPSWNCWEASTTSNSDNSLFDSADNLPGSGGRIGQADKSYARWNNNTGSGSYTVYGQANCGGAAQTFSSSWTSGTHWGSYKRTTVANCP